MPYNLSGFTTLRCHFEGYLSCLEKLSDESGIRKTHNRVCRLVHPNHHMTQDGWEVDWLVVEEPINEIGSVVINTLLFVVGSML